MVKKIITCTFHSPPIVFLHWYTVSSLQNGSGSLFSPPNKVYVPRFLLFYQLCNPNLSAEGQAVLITGWGTGIGLVTAKFCAQAGARYVVNMGRTVNEWETAREEFLRDRTCAWYCTSASRVSFSNRMRTRSKLCDPSFDSICKLREEGSDLFAITVYTLCLQISMNVAFLYLISPMLWCYLSFSRFG